MISEMKFYRLIRLNSDSTVLTLIIVSIPNLCDFISKHCRAHIFLNGLLYFQKNVQALGVLSETGELNDPIPKSR